MKSYMQVPRSHIDPDFKNVNSNPELDELKKSSYNVKVQATDKRKLTLRFTPTKKTS